MELEKLNPKALNVKKPFNFFGYPWLTQKVIDTLRQIDPQLMEDGASDTDLCELLIDLNETYSKYYVEQPDTTESKPISTRPWATDANLAQIEKVMELKSAGSVAIALEEYKQNKTIMSKYTELIRKQRQPAGATAPEPQEQE